MQPQFNQLPPLGLYVHLPWCQQKCPYCDFNSHQQQTIDEQAYIRALIEDLQLDLPLVWGRQISSIFIGGGTPSLFSAASLHQLLSDLRACLNFSPAIEITIEANPGSADAEHFKGYRDAGINRLSIGIQSFNDQHLSALGRIHDASQAFAAYESARNAGFEQINLDLMYGLPGQSVDQSMQDIETALSLKPKHLSYYQLTIEPNTRFHHQPPELPDDEQSWEMQSRAQDRLHTAGFQQYEISAYARDRSQCQHNLNYWTFGDYLGIGAGAHGKITLPAQQRVIRRTRIRQPQAYLTHDDRISDERELSNSDLIFEFMLNALRLTDGFSSYLFQQHTGLPIHCIQSTLDQARQKGLLDIRKDWVQPTNLGKQFGNDLQEIFLDIELSKSGQIEPKIRFE